MEKEDEEVQEAGEEGLLICGESQHLSSLSLSLSSFRIFFVGGTKLNRRNAANSKHYYTHTHISMTHIIHDRYYYYYY